jgi:hypothetical protein
VSGSTLRRTRSPPERIGNLVATPPERIADLRRRSTVSGCHERRSSARSRVARTVNRARFIRAAEDRRGVGERSASKCSGATASAACAAVGEPARSITSRRSSSAGVTSRTTCARSAPVAMCGGTARRAYARSREPVVPGDDDAVRITRPRRHPALACDLRVRLALWTVANAPDGS